MIINSNSIVLCAMNKSNESLQFYDENAEHFTANTISVDMHDTRQHFTKLLPTAAHVLDFGCGSGRDTKAFLDAGYTVDAVDGSKELCRIASEFTGIPVKQMLFQDLNGTDIYDGIWACASILHLPKAELLEVLQKIAKALKPEGILYTSFKYGTFEGIRDCRYFTDFTEETLEQFLSGIPSLQTIETWITYDVRPGREEERWINLLSRRV